MTRFLQRQYRWMKTRPLISSVLALALLLPAAGYEVFSPHAVRAATPPAAAAGPLPADDVSAISALDRAMETLTARVTPAVVNVAVTSRVKAARSGGPGLSDDNDPFSQFFGRPFGFQSPRRPQIEHGIGSGFVISPDGYIVTNNHVVEGATEISVTFSNRQVMTAKVIGTDPLTDLAVIKVDGNNLPSIPWGDSSQLHPGQTVLAFGNPLGYQFSVTSGIVSGLNRSNPDADRRKPGEFIQTDAAINPGNSGGPLVNARGEVQGINTFLISETGGFSGLGFAVPEQIAKPIVEQLIRTGKVEHSRIGVTIGDVTPANAKFFGLKSDTGAVISQVEPDAPGAKAGLKVGDVITGINGQPVEDAGHAQVMITSMRPGTRVEVQILRNGQSQTVPVTLAAMSNSGSSESASDQQGKPRWGMGLSDLTPDVRQQMQVPSDVHGAVVAQVTPGSPADNARIQAGDVILQVNRKDTPNAEAVKNALAAVPSGQDVLLLVWSNGGNSFVVLHAPAQGE